jgi:hypothetical protein
VRCRPDLLARSRAVKPLSRRELKFGLLLVFRQLEIGAEV